MSSQWNDTQVVEMVAGEDLARYRRVKLNGSTVREVVYADAGEAAIGVTRAAVADDKPIGVILLNKLGTLPCIASGAITANALVYPANDGKVTATVTGQAVGRALHATSADGDMVEVLPLLQEIFSDQAAAHGVFDDFNEIVLSDTDRLWTSTLTDTGTATILDAAGGILQLEASDGTIADNDEAYFGMTNETFLFANNKPAWFETRLSLGATDSSDVANVIAGFVSAANAANTLLDNGGGPPASYTGAVFYKIDGGTAWAAECSIAGTQTTVTLTSPGRPSTTYQKLAIEFIPTSSTVATVNFYVDSVLVGSTAAFTYTSATEMMPVVGVKNGDGTTNTTLKVDYVHAKQVR